MESILFIEGVFGVYLIWNTREEQKELRSINAKTYFEA